MEIFLVIESNSGSLPTTMLYKVFDYSGINVTDGTFHSAMTGTFQSDTGGTSIPLLSGYMGNSSEPLSAE